MKSATTPSPGAAAHRVVLDTNAVLDLWAFQDPRVAALRAALEAGALDWVACAGMRDELESVLRRGVAARHGARVEAVLAQWDRHARRVGAPGAALDAAAVRAAAVVPAAALRPTDHLALRCRDPDDQVFLDLALQEQAAWLLSADRDLLTLRRAAARRGLRIARPLDWSAASAEAATGP